MIEVGKAWQILHGDVKAISKKLPENYFDAALGDPPYGLSFMGKRWDYAVPSAMVWESIERTMKPGAHGIFFGGPRTFHRVAVAIEDGGFEIRDLLMWIYGSGFPKSLNISKAIDAAAGVKGTVIGQASRKATGRLAQGEGESAFAEQYSLTAPTTDVAKQWGGQGTGLKPAVEPAILCRKYLDGTQVENALKWGCGALAIDASRIGAERSVVPPAGNTGQSAASLAPVNVTNYGGQFVEGRWPANVIFDEDAAKILDVQSGQSKSSANIRRNSARSHPRAKGQEYEREGLGFEDEGGASRFFYVAKPDRYQRDAGLEDLPLQSNQKWEGGGFATAREAAGLGQGRNTHTTVKPVDLIRYLARMILPPKRDTPRRILVPFSGSGSEMIACLQAGWEEVIGIEREAEYIAIAKGRIMKGGVLTGLMDRQMRRRKRA